MSGYFSNFGREMRKENLIRKFFAVALIGLFVNFMFVNTVFTHTHRMADGSLMSHSHPYQPSTSHSHSTSLLSLISGFNSAASAFQGIASIFLAAISSLIAIDYLCKAPQRLINPQYRIYSLRAPPAIR